MLKFNIPSSGGNQLTECISTRKLPLALAKINITNRLERDYSYITEKIELYQDKCADVLASAFIDRQATVEVILQPILDAINNLINAVNTAFPSLDKRMSKIEAYQEQMRKPLPRKRFSYWQSKMFPKYLLLMEYFEIPEGQNGILYKELYKELHNLYPDIDINQIKDDYCYENKLDNCFTLDAIEHDKTVRKLFEGMVDRLLEKYGLLEEITAAKQKTIFDN